MQDNFERKWEQRHTQALRDTAESLQLGRATAHVVSMQSEQLDRSERLVDETEASVAMSKRVLRGMTWSGWIYNQFSVAPQLLGDKEPAQITMGFICPDCKVKFHTADQLETHYDKLHARISNLKQKGNSFPDHLLQCLDETQKQGTEANEDVHDQFLRDLEPQLAELKDQALALGGALEIQNEQLDRLDTKIERVHHNLKQVSIDADHMAKRKGRKRFRFRCAFQEIETEKFLQDVNGEARVSADVVVDGCTFRAYTLGDNSDVWGFQSETSSRFLGINRYGTLKVQGFDFKTYEQFLVDSKSRTPLFCMSSYFGLGGWVAMTGSVNDRKLTVVRGTLENKSQAAFFRIFHLEEETTKKERH